MFRPIVMFLALLVLSLARPAYADECNSPVFDTTGKVNASEVEPLLKKIAGDGADPALVRVITTAQMNQHGNLDKYAGDMLGRCPSWQSAGGRLKSNIFLLILEPNGKVAVQFAKKGPFQNVLTHNKILDISQEMGGLIGKGDLTGAAKAGLIRTHGILSTAIAEPRIVSGGPVTIVNHNEKPADLSGGFSFLKWLLFIGIIGAGIWLFVRYQSMKSKRQAARQKAQGSLANCNNLIHGFDERLTLLGSILNSYKSSISTTEAQEFQTRLSELDRNASTAKNQFVSSLGSSNDPESVGLSADQYDAMTQVFDKSMQSLSRVDDSLTDLERSIKNISKLKDAAQPAIDELAQEIQTATEKVNAERTLKTDGPRATLKSAIDSLELATQNMQAKSYQAVANNCKAGIASAKKAAQQVGDLASRKRQIEEAISMLDGFDLAVKLTEIDRVISETRQFGDSEVAATNTDRATVLQKSAERRMAVSSAKSATLTQNWDEAERQISIARQALIYIDDAISSVQKLNRSLAYRRQNAMRPSTPGYRSSSGSGRSSSHVSNTTVVNNYGRDDSGLGLGLGLGLALDNIETNAENRELRRELNEERSWGGGGSRRSNDDDSGFGGGSVQTPTSNDDDDRGFGGESVDSSSSSDDSSSNDFSSNDSSSSSDD